MKSETRENGRERSQGQWMAEEMSTAGEILVHKLEEVTGNLQQDAAHFKAVCDRLRAAHTIDGADLQGMAFDVVIAMGRLHARACDGVDAVEGAGAAADFVREYIRWPHQNRRWNS